MRRGACSALALAFIAIIIFVVIAGRPDEFVVTRSIKISAPPEKVFPHVNDLHPTMKPVELVERAVRNSSKDRDTVLDPFGGSGTTLIACERANRQARVVELDPKYCDVIVRRWQDYTGGKAVLEGGGTFDDVAPERLKNGG